MGRAPAVTGEFTRSAAPSSAASLATRSHAARAKDPRRRADAESAHLDGVLRLLRDAAELMNARLFKGALDMRFQVTTPQQGTCQAWGRYRPSGAWTNRSTHQAEVAVFAEGLHRKLDQVLVTLLVGLLRHCNASRGIVDASRQGRYLNRRFAKAAREVGLIPPAVADRRLGFADVQLGPPGTAARDVVDTLVSKLGDRLELARGHSEPSDRPTTMYRYACQCTPPQKFWTSKPTLRMQCEGCGEFARVTETRRKRGSS